VLREVDGGELFGFFLGVFGVRLEDYASSRRAGDLGAVEVAGGGVLKGEAELFMAG
jgi:hypothetical protein